VKQGCRKPVKESKCNYYIQKSSFMKHFKISLAMLAIVAGLAATASADKAKSFTHASPQLGDLYGETGLGVYTTSTISKTAFPFVPECLKNNSTNVCAVEVTSTHPTVYTTAVLFGFYN
jgi:hypothetical protein